MSLWNGISIDFPKLLEYLGISWWTPGVFFAAWSAFIGAYRRKPWVRVVWLPGVLLLLPFPIICVLAVGALFVPGPPGPSAPGMEILLLVPLYLSPFLVCLGIALWFRPVSGALTRRFVIGSTTTLLIVFVGGVEVATRRVEQNLHIIVRDSTGRLATNALVSGSWSSSDDAIVVRRSSFQGTTDSSGIFSMRIWPLARFIARASHPVFGEASIQGSTERFSRHTLRVSESWVTRSPQIYQSINRLIAEPEFRNIEFYLMPLEEFALIPPLRELDDLFQSDPERALAIAYNPGASTAVPVLWHLDRYEELLDQHKASPELADAATRLIRALREECARLPKTSERVWQNYQVRSLNNLNHLCRIEPPTGQDRLEQLRVLDQQLREWHRRLRALGAESWLYPASDDPAKPLPKSTPAKPVERPGGTLIERRRNATPPPAPPRG